MPSMPMTITFLPRLRETRLTLPSQYEPAPTPRRRHRRGGRAFEERSAVGFRGVGSRPSCHLRVRRAFCRSGTVFADWIADRQRLAVHVSGTGTPNRSSTVGPMSSSRGFSASIG